ncbi:MAG TPA: hypothetical protein VGG38_14015 [Acidimicrobiales bacterium]|jgi:hypothetical protein
MAFSLVVIGAVMLAVPAGAQTRIESKAQASKAQGRTSGDCAMFQSELSISNMEGGLEAATQMKSVKVTERSTSAGCVIASQYNAFVATVSFSTTQYPESTRYGPLPFQSHGRGVSYFEYNGATGSSPVMRGTLECNIRNLGSVTVIVDEPVPAPPIDNGSVAANEIGYINRATLNWASDRARRRK